MNYLIHLIATFDHNAGTTACGEVLDTWTVKYPELTGALAYGYGKGSGHEIYEVNCPKCVQTDLWSESIADYTKYLNTPEQEIIDRVDRLKLKFPSIADTLEDTKAYQIDDIRKNRKKLDEKL